MKRIYAIAVVVILVGLIGLQIFRKADKSRNTGMMKRGGAPIAVEAVPAKRITIRDTRMFTGTLSAGSEYMAAPKISGRLDKILVDIGDVVKKDQLIAVLDGEEASLGVKDAKASLNVARANLKESRGLFGIAAKDHKRIKELHGEGIASDADLDAANAQYKAYSAKRKVALAQLKKAQAALDAAKVMLSYTQIRASWENGDGDRVVGERFVDEGAMLAPNQPLVSILDINSLIAAIDITEKDYPRIKIGQETDIVADVFPSRKFKGKISRIAPRLDSASRKAKVEIEIDNSEKLLKPGMFVRAEITFERKENALVVPITAMTKRDGVRGVFLIDEGAATVRFVPIETGIVNGEYAEVVEPAISGKVVVMGQHLLEDGSKIIVPGESASPKIKPEKRDGEDDNPPDSGERAGRR